MIFKASIDQAHGRKEQLRARASACTIADAVQASCSAYPFFDRKTVTTAGGDEVELIDGGYLRQQSDTLRHRGRDSSR